VSECAGSSPTTFAAWGGLALLQLARTYPRLAPRSASHASRWAGTPSVPSSGSFPCHRRRTRPTSVATDMLDRDAGCWEARTDPQCQADRKEFLLGRVRNGDEPETSTRCSRGPGQIHDGVGLPILWWQMPLAFPVPRPAGHLGPHYRDKPRALPVSATWPSFIDAGSVGRGLRQRAPSIRRPSDNGWAVQFIGGQGHEANFANPVSAGP